MPAPLIRSIWFNPLFARQHFFFGGRAADQTARSEKQHAQWEKKRLSREAAGIYLNIFRSNAGIRTSESYIKTLNARVIEMKARVLSGKTLETDILKIRLALDEAKLTMKTLTKEKRILEKELWRIMDLNTPIPLETYPDFSLKPTPEKSALIKAALKNRSDYLALKTREKALRLRTKEIDAQRLPSLELSATHRFDENAPYTRQHFSQGALSITWTPFNSGIRNAKKRATLSNLKAIQHQIKNLKRRIEIEITSALDDVDIARFTINKELKGVSLAQETLRVETQRHKVGRTTTNDLLDAAAQLRKSRTHLVHARLQLVDAFILLALTSGSDQILWEKDTK